MLEFTNSDGTMCPTLMGLNNYEIWKLRITVKLRREKVLGIVLGTDAKPGAVPGSTTSATGATVSTIVAPDPEDVWKWTDISKPKGSCPVLASTGQCYSAHSEGPPV